MREKKKIRVIIGLVIVVFVLFPIAAYLISINNRSTLKGTEIGNAAEELSGVPEYIIENIEKKIYEQLTIDYRKGKIPTRGAEIRSGSAHLFKMNEKMREGHFLVDIGVAEQSYHVYYSYYEKNELGDESVGNELETEEQIVLFCLSNPETVVYQGSGCKSDSVIPNDGTLYDYFTPYATILSSGEEVVISFRTGTTVRITMENKGWEEVEKNEAIAAAKEWVKTYGYDPDQISFETVVSYNHYPVVGRAAKWGDTNIDEDGNGATIQNCDVLKEIAGDSFYYEIQKIIKGVVFDGAKDEEKSEAVAVIDNSSLTEEIQFPYNIYSFDMNVSDGEQFRIIIANNTPSYYGLLVQKTSPGEDEAELYIGFSKGLDIAGDDRAKVIDGLVQWAKTYQIPNIILTTMD